MPKLTAEIKKALEQKDGLIIVANQKEGSTTKTLYAFLNHLADKNLNIYSIEDGVEKDLPHVNQVDIKKNSGVNYQSALAAILKQAPDIIMLENVEDRDLMEKIMHIALTRHLVICSIPAQNKAEVMKKLAAMQIPEFLINSSIKLIID